MMLQNSISEPGTFGDESLFQVIGFLKLFMDEWEGAQINEKTVILKRAVILFDVGKFDKNEGCYAAAFKNQS